MSCGSGELLHNLIARRRPDPPLRNRLSEKEGMKKKELSTNEVLLCHKRGAQSSVASRLDLDFPVPSPNEARGCRMHPAVGMCVCVCVCVVVSMARTRAAHLLLSCLFLRPMIQSLPLQRALHASAGRLSQVPPGGHSHPGSVARRHEEGASAGSHRHDGAVRPPRAGGETAQDGQEENPRCVKDTHTHAHTHKV